MDTLAPNAAEQELDPQLPWTHSTAIALAPREAPPLIVVGRDIGQQLRALDPEQDWHEAPTLPDAAHLIDRTRPQALMIDASESPEAVRSWCLQLTHRPAIVLVSNNALFAHEAFEMGAVDCLTKPIDLGRLAAALERLQTWCRAHRGGAPVPELAVPASDVVSSRWLRMVRNGSLIVTPLDDVIYFQAERKLTRVVLENADGYLHMGINAVAAKLDSQTFWRLHRSTIVNGRFVRVVQRDELGRLKVKMHGRPELLHVSKSHDALWRDGIF